jgi:hypothetical protein
VLLRKLADQAGLTAALGPALERAGKFPLVDRSTGPDVWGRLGDDRFEMSHQVIALDAGGRLSADRPMNPGRSSGLIGYANRDNRPPHVRAPRADLPGHLPRRRV